MQDVVNRTTIENHGIKIEDLIGTWTKTEKDNVLKICNIWINGNLTAQDIRDTAMSLGMLDEFLPERNKNLLSAEVINILSNIEESMLGWGIDEEDLAGFIKDGEEAILELLTNKEYQAELRSVAQKVVSQVEQLLEQYETEALKRGFCPVAIAKFLEERNNAGNLM